MARILSFPSCMNDGTSKQMAVNKIGSPLLWCAIGILLGRAAIFGEMWPLGLAYLAAWRTLKQKRSDFLPLLGVSLGVLSAVGFRLAVPYYAAFTLLWLVPKGSKKSGKYVLIASCLLVKMFLHYLLVPIPMVFILAVTECVLATFSYDLLYFALRHWFEEQLGYVQVLAILVAMSLVVSIGWSWGGFSPRLFLIFLLIALGARLGGISLSCIVGPALALISLLLGEPIPIALFSIISSLLMGLLHSFWWGYYVGPILALVFSLSGSAEPATIQYLITALVASWVGLHVPKIHLELLERMIPGTDSFVQQNKGYDRHLKQVFDHKIDQYLTVFEELEKTLSDNENPLFHKQMQGMAELLKTMKGAFSPDVHFTKELEEKLITHFAQDEISHITVLKSLDGFEIYGARKNRCGMGTFCQEVANFCSGTIESRRYGVASHGCVDGGCCSFKIVPCPTYKLEIGKANLAQEDVSGDSQITFEVGSSKVAIVLSDGMGVGPKAQAESSVAVRLLERMIKAGYDLSTAVSLINRLLILRNQEDMFVTIDLVVVDLFSGQLEFVKIGAAPSFIKRGREVEIIHNHALPVGVLSQVDVEADRRILKEGEVLVMATDGVLDVQRNIVRKDEWMCWNLRRLHDSKDMATMAADILADSLEVSEGHIHDDMMVVVARLVKANWEIESYRRAQLSVL